MTKHLSYLLLFTLLLLSGSWSRLCAQVDTTGNPKDTTFKPADSVIAQAKDTVVSRKVDSTFYNHSPRTAAIRSAIIPGWGQVYNRQIWKVPLVYGALGTAGAVFVYNLKNYRDFRFAYKAKYEASKITAGSPRSDSADFFNMKEQFQNPNWDLTSLRYYRNEFRKNIDYSVLVFVLLWGLNVADAAAAAHLRTFDVSPDLTFQIKPGYSDMANTRGLSLVLAFK